MDQLGQGTVNLGNSIIYVGLAVSNGVANATSTAMASFDEIQCAFLPSEGLRLWLSADAGIVPGSDAQSIGTWSDQSGYGNDGSQAGGTRQPAVVNGALNSKPVVRFDASKGQYLNLPDFLSGSAGAEMVMVLKSTAAAGTSNGLSTFGTLPNSDLYTYANGNLYSGFATTSQYNQGASPTSLAQFNLYHLSSQPGLWQSWMNGVPLFQSHANTVAFTNAPLLGLDREGYYFTGDIAEVLVYNRALSNSERQAAEVYLSKKYALANGAVGVAIPTNLSATPISASQVNLFWKASPSAVGYSVERKDATASDSDYVEVAGIAGGEVQAYLDGALTPGASYTYRLRAYNLIDYSGYSTAVNATTSVTDVSVLPAGNLLLWLKPDAGVTQDASGLVSAWVDASGHGNNAFAPVGNQPQWVDGVLNGKPTLRFNGSSYLQLPSGFSDFTQGITALVVAKPTAVVNYGRFFDLGNGAARENVLLCRNASSNGLEFYSQSSPFELDSASSLELNRYQLVECTQNPSTQTATTYKNGSILATGSVGNIAHITRSSNFIARSNWNEPLYQGDIVEVLLFDHALTDVERQAWELYLNVKYQYDAAPPAPTRLSTALLSATQVAINWVDAFDNIDSYRVERQNSDGSWSVVATLGAGTTSYVVSGLAPGTQYAFRVIATNHAGDSPAAATTVTTANSGSNFPVNSLRLWLRADAGSATSGNGALDQWTDQSSNGFSATQGSTGNRPQVIATALNGYPAVRFDGSSAFLNLPGNLMAGLGEAEVFIVQRAADPIVGVQRGFWRFNDASISVYPWSDGKIYDTFGTTVQYGFSPGSIPLDQFNLYNVAAAPGTWMARLNGQTLFSSLSNAVSFAAGAFTLGRDRDGRLFAGDVAEMLIFDHALTNAERETVEGYLNRKYAVVSLPGVPTNPIATAISTSQINLFWNASPQVSGYMIERKDAAASDNDYAEIAYVSGSEVQAYIDSSLTPGASYSYRLRAYNLAGYSAYSAAVTASLPATGAVSLPTDDLLLWLKPDAGVTQDASGLVSAWIDASGRGNNAFASMGWQPQWLSNALNGQPVIRFEGSSSYLQLPSGFSDFTQGVTMMVVAKTASTANYARFFDIGVVIK